MAPTFLIRRSSGAPSGQSERAVARIFRCMPMLALRSFALRQRRVFSQAMLLCRDNTLPAAFNRQRFERLFLNSIGRPQWAGRCCFLVSGDMGFDE